YVYNMFLSTDADLAIVEKLYEKLLNIERAVGSTKPIIGEEVRVANLRASSNIWRTGEVGEIDYRGKKVRLTEHRMIYAELTDQLDELVRAFLATVQSLNNELRSKNIFPIYSAKKIKDNLKMVIETENLEAYEQVLRDLFTRVGHMEGKSEYEINSLKHPVRILEYLKVNEEEGVPRLLFTTSELGSGVFHIIKVQVNGRDYYLGYDRDRREILSGIKFLEFIEKISKNGFSVPTSYIVAEEFKTLKINQRSFILNTVQRMLGDLLSPYSRYFRETEAHGIRKNGWRVDLTIGEPEVVSTVLVTRYEEDSEKVDEVLKKKVEMAAMGVSTRYERSKDDVIKVDPEVHKTESYDILSHLQDGRKRYIEVKGHTGLKAYAVLTPNEYELAQMLGDDYYLHLVMNLHLDEYEEVDTTKAVLLEFRNPLKTMRVRDTGGEKRYILFP
ncbi:MAG TPA: DUF3883 domain-containing protein, partial [Thermoplasmatales archaeon]|nr:DUF3883 domain-containing protein [Thermoplasmatales archaeon]